MSHHAVSHQAMPVPELRSPAVGRLYHGVVDRFLLLPLGALIGLVWANTAGESYFGFSHALAFGVNEVAMAFFLALIVQDVREALMAGGALHTWRFWALPLFAAAGGMLGAAGVYLAYVHWSYEPVLAQAWPVTAAIDVAAGYYVLKTIWRRSNALPFLLLLALATDACGVLYVTLRSAEAYTAPGGLLLMFGAVGLAAALSSMRVQSFWPYLAICGTASWWALYLMHIHPALALVPIVPFLPREPRRLDLFADPAPDDAVHTSEHRWNEVVQVVLFFFGLVNAGVILKGYGTGTWAMLAAAIVGRPLGILVAVGLGALLGFRLPKHVGWREMIVVALATSSGFTFALFFATGAIPLGPVLAEIKLGALATVVAVGVTLAAARLLRVGRFAR
jgi:Na+:H+ antiporter, NhaA family